MTKAAVGGIVTTLALVVGCASTTGGSGVAQSTPPVISSTTTLEPTTVTQTQTLTQTTAVQTTTVQPSTPAPPRSTSVSRSADPSDAAIRAKVAAAVGVVETYWVDLFSTWVDDAGNPVAWWPPQLLNGDGFFDSTSGSVPRCGDDDGDNADNAFSCGSVAAGTGYMAWDMQLFRDYSSLGDAVFYMVVAHETGHAGQIRFEHDGEGPAVLANRELQADCIGGATLAKAEQDGYLVLEDGDLQEMTRVSLAMGDYSGDSHGTPEERDFAFKTGYNGDIESCLGNR